MIFFVYFYFSRQEHLSLKLASSSMKFKCYTLPICVLGLSNAFHSNFPCILSVLTSLGLFCVHFIRLFNVNYCNIWGSHIVFNLKT